MALPTSGPIYVYPSEAYADNYRARYKQARPIDRPLPYRMYRFYGLAQSTVTDTAPGGSSSSTGKSATFNIQSQPDYAVKRDHAYNQAYGRLQGEVSNTAGWAENIAQAGKARKMFNDRLMQLAHFAIAIKQRRYGDAARTLRTPLPSGVSHRKAVSQNFLEFEYGIKPLIADVKSSWDIITSDPEMKKVRGRGNGYFSSSKVVNYFNGSSSTPYRFIETTAVHGKVTATCISYVRITNPNLFLANQVGLIDFALPWKLMPFSFVVDWFVNVEQVISSASDWFGVSLQHPMHTIFRRGAQTYFRSGSQIYTLQSPQRVIHVLDRAWRDSIEVERVMGLPGPTLVLKPFKGFSLQRGAQACALVLSVFGR